MSVVSRGFLLVLIFLNASLFHACLSKNEKKVISYVNSFHRGHPSSDEIMDGILTHFPADSFEVATYFMDTKREPDSLKIKQKAAEVFESIVRDAPDILLVSDDNAVKYLVQPHLDELNMPIIFCGVNWTDAEYELPPDKVTGMLEILPVANMVVTMQSYFPSMEKLLFLSENTTTSRKEELLLDTLFTRTGLMATYRLVDDYTEWKAAFKAGNRDYDIIYLPTNGAIKGWDRDDAIQFIHRHLQVPVVTTEDFMMPYAVFGLTKVAREQGEWVAITAKKILNGARIIDFPVTTNKKSAYWINASLAGQSGFEPDSALLGKSTIVRHR